MLLLRVHMSVGNISTDLYFYTGHSERRSEEKCVAKSCCNEGVLEASQLTGGIAFSAEWPSKRDSIGHIYIYIYRYI